CLLVGKNSPVQSFQDLDQPSRVVAVKKGTTGHLFATDKLKAAKLLVLDKESACILEIIQGKPDAFIYDQISTYENWQRNQETTRPLLKPFQEESWAIGLRQDDNDLREKVNAFLKAYQARDGCGQLGDRWLKEQKEAFKKLGIPF